jgi:hypothetical protein
LGTMIVTVVTAVVAALVGLVLVFGMVVEVGATPCRMVDVEVVLVGVGRAEPLEPGPKIDVPLRA